jgi:hypothetical protein
LKKAISHAKLMKATLVIAKLDRLARNVAFTSALMETKVDFVCCDNPEADTFTIHILAAAAEKEARDISNPHEGLAGCGEGQGREARLRSPWPLEGPRAPARLEGSQQGVVASPPADRQGRLLVPDPDAPRDAEARQEPAAHRGVAQRARSRDHSSEAVHAESR